MKDSIIIRITCLAAMFGLAAVAAQAQTTCPGPVAQITSPAPASTLPSGAVAFSWCHANKGDYFLDIGSVPGAHEIFFAFLTVESITLGPGCNIPSATSPQTGCIVPNGETIYVTLWTNTAVSGRKNYVAAPTLTFTAASSNPTPAATTIAVGNKTATASNTDQNITLTATVAGGTVNQGAVTFQLLDGATKIGAAVTSAALTTGSASALYLLPRGTPANTYTIQADYSGGTNFQPSSGNGTLAIAVAPPAAPTTTTVAPQTVTSSGAVQNVTLTATVTGALAVNEGTVTFQVMDGAANVGAAVTSTTLIAGNTSAIYVLPAGLAAGNYTIQAAYSGGTTFLASSNVGTLTVNATPPPVQFSTGTTVNDNSAAFSANIQQVTLTAAVTVPAGTVNEGTVTFQVMDAATNIGSPVPSATLTSGSAAVSYTLPAGLAAGNYTIQAAYAGGPDFLASSGTGTMTIIPAVAVSGLTLAQGSLMSFSSTQATVTLNQPAPAPLGTIVTLTSSVPATVGVPVSITIPAGGTTAAFTITAGPVAASTSVTISAAVNGLGQSAILTVLPLPVPISYTLSPWTIIGPGVVTTATVALSQAAPSGGIVVTLSASDTKSAKFPSTVTVAAGQSSVAFPVQGNGVSTTTAVTLQAASNGGTASAGLTVAPSDSLHITSATYSKSQQLLQVKGTSTNPAATIVVQNANNNAILGTMTNLGNGSYSYQLTLATGVPTSVNIISNLGGKAGQGIAVIP